MRPWSSVRACRCRSRWPRATASPTPGGICCAGSRRRWPRGCPSGPRWRRGPSGCWSACSPRTTRSSAFPAFGEIAGLPVGRTGARAAGPVVPRPPARPRCPAPAATAGGGAAGAASSTTARLFPLGDVPDYEPAPETSIARHGGGPGHRPGRARCSTCWRERRAGTSSTPRSPNYAEGNLDACGEMLAHPDTVFGLGDGGAHVGPDRRRELPDLLALALGPRPLARPHAGGPGGRAAHEQHGAGRRPRTTVASWPAGMRADLNVIDFDRLRCETPVMAYDLPAGGKRLLRVPAATAPRSWPGEITYRDGEPTGALPGRLVRGGRDTRRPPDAREEQRP